MFKLNITDEMINYIKECREKYNVKSSDLATKIGKSNAYVSKFDKGDYKTISYNELCQMLSAICDKTRSTDKVEITEEGIKLADDFLTNFILNDKNNIYNKDCGLMTYDEVIRKIEIPSELIDCISNEIKNNNLTISSVVKKVNENDEIPEYLTNAKYDFNTYYFSDESTSSDIDNCFIKISLDETQVVKILNKEVTTTNYLTIKALLYTINKLKNIGESLLLTLNTLSQYHFYNLKLSDTENYAKEIMTETYKEMENMPSSLVITTCALSQIICSFYKQHPAYMSTKIYGLHNNLSSDAALVIACLDLAFEKIKDLDITTKRKFFDDVNELLVKYSEKKSDEDKFQII